MLIIFFFVCSSFLQCVLLFPYTTLFRSRTEVRVRGHRHPERQARALPVPPQWRGRYRPVDTGPAIEVEREGPELVAQDADGLEPELPFEIGRASCRETVEHIGGTRNRQKKR